MPVLALALIAFFTYIILEPFWIKTRYISIQSKRIPESFKGYRFGFLSDIHFEAPFAPRLRRTVRHLGVIAPDLLIIGGDYVTYGKANLTGCFSILKGLRLTDGVYCALGNHDYHTGVQWVKEAIAESQFHLLDNDRYWLSRGGERILLAGVGDWQEGSQLTEKVLAERGNEDFCIMVSHNADYFIENPNGRIDLALSGHTHGGQLTFFGIAAPMIKVKHKKYRYGLFRLGEGKLYVTSGLGTTFPRMRFFSRPEVVIFTLTP
jgi:uncharacterized protein